MKAGPSRSRSPASKRSISTILQRPVRAISTYCCPRTLPSRSATAYDQASRRPGDLSDALVRQAEQLGHVAVAHPRLSQPPDRVIAAKSVRLGVGHGGSGLLDRTREIAEADVPVDVELL